MTVAGSAQALGTPKRYTVTFKTGQNLGCGFVDENHLRELIVGDYSFAVLVDHFEQLLALVLRFSRENNTRARFQKVLSC